MAAAEVTAAAVRRPRPAADRRRGGPGDPLPQPAAGPALLAAIASAGGSEVEVAARPRIAVLATGSELVRPGAPLRPGQIYESNAIALAVQAARAGAVVVASVTVADDRAATERAF